MSAVTETDDYEPAGLRSRALAYLLDFAVFGAVLVAVATRSKRSVPARAAVALGVVGASLYHVLLEGGFGRTVGKAVVGIAVVDEDGSDCTYRAAAVRTALRFVDWAPVAYLAGVLSIRLTERRQRVGDLVANTVVVRTRDE